MSVIEYASYALSVVAIVSGAIGLGADFFATIVLRPALSHLEEHELTRTMGFIHRYGDQRMPAPFVLSLVAAGLAAGAAAWAHRCAAAVAMGVTVVALLAWIAVYLKVSGPINRKLTAAAVAGRALPDASALQRRWDRAVPARLGLNVVAIVAGCIALVLP
jgi:hypothetical protein